MTTVKTSLERSRKISQAMKKKIAARLGPKSYYVDGRVLKLSIPMTVRNKTKKISGVDMGADAKGFFVYTHRARCKSHPTPEGITVKEIKFIETTG